MLNFDELAELDGLIGRDVGELLYEYATAVESDCAIVELGSYRGKSTCYLATGAIAASGAVFRRCTQLTHGAKRFGVAQFGDR